MQSQLNASFDECGTSALGIGIPQFISPKNGPLNKGHPFQVVCHLSLLNWTEAWALPQLGYAQLLIRLPQATFLLPGPVVERASAPAGAMVGAAVPAAPVLGVAPLSAPGWKLGSCMAIMFGTPKLVGKWMRHQLELGVDGVHMYTYADATGVASSTREAIGNASAHFELVEWPVTPWKRVGQFGDYAGQDNALSHCIVRNAPKYKWIIVSDTDEFLQLAPQSGSLSMLIALREAIWGEVDKLQVDVIAIQRDAVRGTPDSIEECQDNLLVLPKSIVNTRTAVRMSPHGPTAVFTPGLLLKWPVQAKVAHSAMRFAHFASGYKGCVETPAKAASSAVNMQRAEGSLERDLEREHPDDCLAVYTSRLDGTRTGLGAELLEAWGKSDGEESGLGPVALAVGGGEAATAMAAAKVAEMSGVGTARLHRLLPGPGSSLDTEWGHRFVLRFLGWDGAATLPSSELCRCYDALQHVVEGGGAELGAPRSLLAVLSILPHNPYIVDSNVDVIFSQALAMDMKQLQDFALGGSPASLALRDACGHNITSYSWEQLSSLHEAFLEAAQCMSPRVSVMSIPANAAKEDFSVSSMMPE